MPEEQPKKEKFLRKAERQACWGARDQFWDCMKATGEKGEMCTKPRKMFEELCPPTWVTHFDRKFQFEKFKSKLAESGYESQDSEFTKEKK